MPLATSSFDVTGWDQSPPSDEAARPSLSTAVVLKSFSGDLEAESRADLSMCTADPTDIAAGAGYIASEVVTGQLHGRAGTFVMHHWGVSSAAGQHTGGHIVPGSGTGELAGLTGSIEIAVDAEGAHSITLDYELPD